MNLRRIRFDVVLPVFLLLLPKSVAALLAAGSSGHGPAEDQGGGEHHAEWAMDATDYLG